MPEYARCNFDGRALHPDDKKTLDMFIAWLRMSTPERLEAVRDNDEWYRFVFGRDRPGGDT